MSTREELLRERTRMALVHVLEDAVGGDELIFKEVWEECKTDEEIELVRKHIHELVARVERNV